jgi:hypothetical protein
MTIYILYELFQVNKFLLTIFMNPPVISVMGFTNVNRRLFAAVSEWSSGLVVRVPGCRSRGPGSIPGATTFSEKQWVWNWVHLAS